MKKLNAAMDCMTARMDELGDDAIQAMRNTPEARARQAANRAKAAKNAAIREAKRQRSIAAAVAANTFVVGQTVRSVRRMGADFLVATVTAVSGSTVTLDNGGRYSASAFAAA